MSTAHPIDQVRLDGGRPCLDFINTVHRRPAGPGDECLRTLDDFLDWLEHAGIVSSGDRSRLGRRGDDGGKLLERILDLREGLYRLLVPVARGASPAARDMAWLSAIVARARGRQVLDWANERARWRTPVPPAPDFSLTDPLVIDAAELLTHGRLDRIRECDPEEGCGWLFEDTSRNGSRRWCSMDTCGSAAKARAWYHRHRGR